MNKVGIVLCLSVFCFSCAKDKILHFSSSVNIGTDSTLDIITWNVENFPKHHMTIDYMVELINMMDVDIIALQEIEKESDLKKLISNLDGWVGGFANDSYGLGLAFLYKSYITVNALGNINELDDYNLTRIPFLIEINWKEENIYIINNHYKCCGNGTIENVYNDEEFRRQQACILTKNYIDSSLAYENVIVLGDFNDELNDVDSANVFQSFINDSINYKFTDMDIAFGSSANWSYPGWPSHLDHILITNELFDKFENPFSSVQTIHLESFIDGGWNVYYNFVSDHRPVGLYLYFSP